MSPNNSLVPNQPSKADTSVDILQKKIFITSVDIFREKNGSFNKVTTGTCKIENNLVTISANITKSFEINNILEIYKNYGKLFIYLKTRNQPFILASIHVDELFDIIVNLLSKNKRQEK